MFLIETVKRIFRDMPEAKEPEEGWDWFEDETNPLSWNYQPTSDPLNPACPLNPSNPAYPANLHDD